VFCTAKQASSAGQVSQKTLPLTLNAADSQRSCAAIIITAVAAAAAAAAGSRAKRPAASQPHLPAALPWIALLDATNQLLQRQRPGSSVWFPLEADLALLVYKRRSWLPNQQQPGVGSACVLAGLPTLPENCYLSVETNNSRNITFSIDTVTRHCWSARTWTESLVLSNAASEAVQVTARYLASGTSSTRHFRSV